MAFDMLIVFILLLVTILLFISDRLRLDLVALLAVLALMLSGILTPGEALAGFSDPIVLTIAGLFIVGTGLFQTGVADVIGQGLTRLAGSGELRLLVMVMVVVALLSAFLSSTGTVAILLPVVVSLATRAQISPAKLLIPLAYASLIGGMLTLIGTPPNIVVNNQLLAVGLEPFGFFVFAPVGIVMLVLGVAYMVVVGRHLLPAGEHLAQRRDGIVNTTVDLMRLYRLPGKLFRVRVLPSSPLVGQTVAQAHLRDRYHVNVLARLPVHAVHQAGDTSWIVLPVTVLHENDVLQVKGTIEHVADMAREQLLEVLLAEERVEGVVSDDMGIVEVLLTPRSRLIGQSLHAARFRDTYNVTVLAILRLGTPLVGPTSREELRFGDTLLVLGTWEQIGVLLEERRDVVVVGQPPALVTTHYNPRRAPVAAGIMLAMLVLFTLNVLPTVTAVLLAAVAMVLTRCLTMEDVYRTMNWESVVLIAGMLPMATALEKTGGMQVIATGLTTSLGVAGPLAVMAGLFALTSLSSQVISNTATTVLMAPIALQAATSLGIAPHALLMAVAVAASTAFATPVASPVNTLVLGPGGYRFSDFIKVGVPLQVLLMIASLLVLPLIFPL